MISVRAATKASRARSITKSCRTSLRHSTVATTQNHYIKPPSPDAIAAMKQFSEALLCSTCAPDGDVKAKGSVQ
jgi:hypothetical protein